MNNSHITASLLRAKKLLGSYNALGRVCSVSGKAVMKWVAAGRLPRTEYTGETHYADMIQSATHGAITREDLRPDIFRRDHPATPTATPVHSAIPDSSICPPGHSE
ncbi:helix-turn-helix domain-containing protein [Acidithiobacillus thiooxidans]|uniref:YdaS family helix-turn-helix protein n=1 Tax=Acidithiobacillus thiooxidans TaxID=930 RepID=UPI001C06D34F|nr:YdaS family helix-turn-helix protein [Acidithiobacillus thiooxidans]MBU2750814.1 helix-turn-helix domain-containing protein [Acidithiobacillus thiooxidans]